jgi:hypothetical protein
MVPKRGPAAAGVASPDPSGSGARRPRPRWPGAAPSAPAALGGPPGGFPSQPRRARGPGADGVGCGGPSRAWAAAPMARPWRPEQRVRATSALTALGAAAHAPIRAPLGSGGSGHGPSGDSAPVALVPAAHDLGAPQAAREQAWPSGACTGPASCGEVSAMACARHDSEWSPARDSSPIAMVAADGTYPWRIV